MLKSSDCTIEGGMMSESRTKFGHPSLNFELGVVIGLDILIMFF